MKRLPLVRSLAGVYARFDPGAGNRAGTVEVPWAPERPAAWGAATKRPNLGWRGALAAALLVLLPVLVYGPAIFVRYGFRDDYAVLREAHEEPAKVLAICAMQARPIDGALLALSFRHCDGIDGLANIRLASTLLMGGVAAALFVVLCAFKWDSWTAGFVAALVTLLPSAQIVIGWAVGWPLPVALLLGLGAFLCAERAFDGPSGVRPSTTGCDGVGWWIAAVVLLATSALIYQPNSLFYCAGVTAALWSRRSWGARRGWEWLGRHAATVVCGLLLAFTSMMVAFASGALPASRRIGLERDWLGKIEWFLTGPLQNAAGLVALNHNGGAGAVHAVAALVAIVIVAGLLAIWRTRGGRHSGWWILGLLATVVSSFAVNLAVADRWPSYRVLTPLAVTMLLVLAMALRFLGGRWVARIGVLVLLLPGVWLAGRQTMQLIAAPQAAELRAVEAGAARIPTSGVSRVFVRIPVVTDVQSRPVFLDEFGSLSTDSDWTPKEMLKLVLGERYADSPEILPRYTYSAGHVAPTGPNYDVLIDLRALQQGDLPAGLRSPARNIGSIKQPPKS